MSASPTASTLPGRRTLTHARDRWRALGRELTGRVNRGLDRLGPMRPSVHPWVALMLFVLTAVITQRFAVEHMASVVAGNGVEDPPQFMWAMWWWPHAILHGLNPFVTHEIWYPNAYNLATVTSTPAPALVLSPLTWAFGHVSGPIISYNVAALAAPVLGAFLAYRLCFALARAPAASILGGWLFGFSTYGFSQMEGHLNLIWTFLAPAMALLVIRYGRDEISAPRFIVLGAIALLFEMGSSTEVLFTTTLLGAVTLIVAFALMPARRVAIVAVLAPLAGAYLLAGAIGSVFLYYALTGPSVQVAPLSYPIDLLNFFLPTRITYLGGAKFAGISGQFLGNTSEQGGYLGVPLILMVLACWSQRWRARGTRVLLVMTLVAAIWSLGEFLVVGGHQTFLELPFHWVVDDNPFDKLLPDRISQYTALGAAVAAALWLGSTRRPRIGRWVLGLAAVVFLFPNANSYLGSVPLYREGFYSPSFFTTGQYRHYLHRDEVILPIPFGATGSSLLWQAQAQGWFREASGWFGLYPPDYADSAVVGQLSDFGPATDTGPGLEGFIRSHGVQAVVVQAGEGGHWSIVLANLGLHPEAVGGVDIYRIPR